MIVQAIKWIIYVCIFSLFFVIFIHWLFKDHNKVVETEPNGTIYEPDMVEKIEVIDGDTLKIYYKNNNGWFGADKENIRLPRIDTAETNDKEIAYKKLAYLAKAFVTKWIEEAKHIKVINTKARDKYGRPMPEIEIDGENLSDKLLKFEFGGVECSLAVEYKGKNKNEAWGRK